MDAVTGADADVGEVCVAGLEVGPVVEDDEEAVPGAAAGEGDAARSHGEDGSPVGYGDIDAAVDMEAESAPAYAEW